MSSTFNLKTQRQGVVYFTPTGKAQEIIRHMSEKFDDVKVSTGRQMDTIIVSLTQSQIIDRLVDYELSSLGCEQIPGRD